MGKSFSNEELEMMSKEINKAMNEKKAGLITDSSTIIGLVQLLLSKEKYIHYLESKIEEHKRNPFGR